MGRRRPSAPRRRRGRGAVLGGLLAGAVLVGTATPAAAAPGRPGQEPPSTSATLTLASQPASVAPDEAFTVFLDITGAPKGSRVVADLYPRAQGLGDLAATGSPEVSFDPVPVVPTAGGGQAAVFTIDLYGPDDAAPAGPSAYQLDEPGAYPVRIRLQDAQDARLDTMVTTLIRQGAEPDEVTPTDVALVTAVHADVPLDAEERRSAAGADPQLVEDLAPVLEAYAEHPDVPVAFAVTPDTASRLVGDAATISALRTELGRDGRELLDAPYVDIDPAALVEAGLQDELTRQLTLGRRTLTDVLEAPTEGTTWLTRPVDAAALSALRSRGISRYVLGPELVTGGTDRGPVALPAGAHDVTAVVAPSSLRLEASADPVLAVHDLLARLAVTATDVPSGVAIAVDPATTDPTTLDLLLDVLDGASGVVAAQPLSALLDGAVQPAPDLVAPVPQDLGTYPEEVVAAHADLVSYGSMVAGRAELLAPYEVPLATSAAAELPLADRRRDLATLTEAIREPFTAISVPDADKVTLGAREAEFPLPITSELDYPVQVLVELTSNDRLEFPDGATLLTLKSPRETVPVKVVSKAAGDTPVRISVRTPDGRVELAETRYVIRSTAVSGMGLLLTIGAGSFLALWWGRHWFRTRRARRADAAV